MSALFVCKIGLKFLCFVDNVHKLWIKLLNNYKLFENCTCIHKIALLIELDMV